MCDLDFKRMVYLFVLCNTLFPSSYYNMLSTSELHDDIQNFEKLSRGVDVHEEILREMSMQRKTLSPYSLESDRAWRFSLEDALLLHYGVDLISIVSSRMLKWAPIP